MSDLISRKEVAEILNHQRFGIAQISWDIISEKIKALPSVEQTEWISVKDRLPTENDEYYVSVRYECDDGTAFDDVTTCYFWAKEGMWNRSERMIGKILAWQPITEPSPYKGDE